MIKIKSLRLSISIFTLFAAAALFYADFSVYTLLAILAAVLHESGHLAATRVLGAAVQEISIYPFGADIRINNAKLTYGEELIIALAGPAANLAAALFTYGCLLFRFSTAGAFFFFSNLALFIVNILPIKTLDGGKALECVLCAGLPLERALKIIEPVSAVFFAALTLSALFVIAATRYNFSLLILCAYLFLSVYINEKRWG